MFPKADPKKQAIDELMQYLDGKDGEELGEVVKPKGPAIEVAKIEKVGDEPSEAHGADDVAKMGDPSKPEMSDDEIAELIEALQSKLSC